MICDSLSNWCLFYFGIVTVIVVAGGFFFGWVGLAGVLSDDDGFALAVLRHSDHADVIVDARLQSVDSILTSRWQNNVFEDGHALAGRYHHDPVTGDGCGVERRPEEANGGVAHVLKCEVCQLWDFWVGGRERKREDNRNTKQTRGKGGGGWTWGPGRGRQRTKRKKQWLTQAFKNDVLPLGCNIRHIRPMEDMMLSCLSWYI